MPGSHKNDWNGGGLLEGNVVGNEPNITSAGYFSCSQAKNGQAENTITGSNVFNARSHGRNDPGHFISENARIGRFSRIKGERLEHVAEIHSGGFDIDDHVAGIALRRREGNKLKCIEVPPIARLEAQWDSGIESFLYGGTAAIKSLHISRLPAQSDFALRFRAQQFRP